MRIIPVIDVQQGIVVRGVGGRRNTYRPLTSCVTKSVFPVTVARNLVDRFQPEQLYLADLDAIAGNAANWPSIVGSIERDIQWLIDAGVRALTEAIALADVGVLGIVCGLETLDGYDAINDIVASIGADRIVFSIDLKKGRMLGHLQSWPVCDSTDVLSLVEAVASIGIRRFIALDLADVGEGRGVGTLELCRSIRSLCPAIELIAGGGVRGPDDLRLLTDAGVDAALVASALHDGRIQ